MPKRTLLEHQNEAVKFTLKKYNLQAKWKIIPLSFDRWRLLMEEEHKLDVLSEELRKAIEAEMETQEVKEAVKKGDSEVLEAIKMFEEGKALDKLILKEYGRLPSEEERLKGSASTFHLKHFEVKPSIEKHCPFLSEMTKKYREKDFLIFLNKALGEPRRQKLLDVIHETLHFVNEERGTRRTSEEIEGEAQFILEEFLKTRKRGSKR